jgi:hypothetical protein
MILNKERLTPISTLLGRVRRPNGLNLSEYKLDLGGEGTRGAAGATGEGAAATSSFGRTRAVPVRTFSNASAG